MMKNSTRNGMMLFGTVLTLIFVTTAANAQDRYRDQRFNPYKPGPQISAPNYGHHGPQVHHPIPQPAPRPTPVFTPPCNGHHCEPQVIVVGQPPRPTLLQRIGAVFK